MSASLTGGAPSTFDRLSVTLVEVRGHLGGTAEGRGLWFEVCAGPHFSPVTEVVHCLPSAVAATEDGSLSNVAGPGIPCLHYKNIPPRETVYLRFSVNLLLMTTVFSCITEST